MKNRCIIIVSSSSFAFVCVCVEIYFRFLGSFFMAPLFIMCFKLTLNAASMVYCVAPHSSPSNTSARFHLHVWIKWSYLWCFNNSPHFGYFIPFLGSIFLSPPFILISLLLYFYEIKLTFSNLQIIYCVYFIGYSCEFYLSLWKYTRWLDMFTLSILTHHIHHIPRSQITIACNTWCSAHTAPHGICQLCWCFRA